ncbi:MAG: ATP-binding protein [Gemmatimonadota bacterium]
MRITTRLLLLLLPTVVVVMMLYVFIALRERERTQIPKAELETRAYATALSLALGDAYPDLGHANVQTVINQVSLDPRVFGIIVYGPDGQRRFVSDPLKAPGLAPPDALRRAMTDGQAVSFQREIDDQLVLSVLRPIVADSGIVGALEVAQPLSFLETEKAGVRRRFLFNTLTLLLALSLVTLLLVRRVVGRPLEDLLLGARALGRGEFSHRIPVTARGSELAALGVEFNTMAGNLEQAHAELIREAEERVMLERRLRQSEKMADIGRLAAGLAHQIAAPLNVISGRAEILLRHDQPRELQEKNLTVIIRQIERITGIVRSLLNFARRREPRMQECDLVEVIGEVLDLLKPELTRLGIRVIQEGPALLPLTGDPALLEQVFDNLLINALQSLEEVSGERRIVLRITTLPGPAGSSRSGVAEIVVEDSGPGIAPSLVPRLFEPFFTTKNQGTGLGLMMVKTYVEEHGGSVEATPGQSGRGGIFTVRLPRYQLAEASLG